MNAFATAKSGLELFDTGDNRFPIDTYCLSGCDCCQCIIDIIKSSQGDYNFSPLGLRFNLDAQAINTICHNVNGSYVSFGALALTLGALIMSKMTVVLY